MDVTCVTAPQDVAADMGPTVMCPRTHTDRRAHQRLSGKPELPCLTALCCYEGLTITTSLHCPHSTALKH